MTRDTDIAASKPYSGWMATCDGLHEFEIGTTVPDGPWPAMVKFEFSYGGEVVGGTMTGEDAESLAAHIGAAAGWAKFENRRVKAEADRG